MYVFRVALVSLSFVLVVSALLLFTTQGPSVSLLGEHVKLLSFPLIKQWWNKECHRSRRFNKRTVFVRANTGLFVRANRKITIARPITEADYRRRSSVLNGDQGGSAVATVAVDRRSCHEVPVSVTQAGSRLCWEYETEDHDIGFSVVRGPDVHGADDVTLLPWQREDSHLKPREGSLLCQEPGTYVLKFDNSFSACRGKKLTYTVRVVPPTISDDAA